MLFMSVKKTSKLLIGVCSICFMYVFCIFQGVSGLKPIPSSDCAKIEDVIYDSFDINFAHFHEENIGSKLEGETFEAILSYLLLEMTNVNHVDIHSILEEDVPKRVNKGCELVEDIVCSILRKARISSHCSLDPPYTTSHEFYQHLKNLTQEHRTKLKFIDDVASFEDRISDILSSLEMVACLSVRDECYSPGEDSYSQAWTSYLSDIMKMVALGNTRESNSDYHYREGHVRYVYYGIDSNRHGKIKIHVWKNQGMYYKS